MTITLEKPRTKRTLLTVVPKTTPKYKVMVTKKIESHKLQENVKEMLLNTNATPIRCKGGMGYACSFCTDQFPEPADLKHHTLKNHDAKDKSDFMKGVRLYDFAVKLDITDLKCLCGTILHNMEELVDHLRDKHNKQMQANVIKHVIPFKFKDVLCCAICSLEFNNFKVLMEHMNVHYGNHVCEVCGSGFINKKTLSAHGHRHKTGSFPCATCSKVFDTKIKKMEHERAVHVHRNRRNKCGYCGEKFTDYTKKNDHEVKVHGAKPVVLHCQACDKIFDNQRSLTVHSKTYHMLQKKK